MSKPRLRPRRSFKPLKPQLLDLFCGAGGAAKGYQQAGFEVIGVDIKPQPHYCGDAFVEADAIEVLEYLVHPRDGIDKFSSLMLDAIHASPPCQAYSIAAVQQRNAGVEYPDLVAKTRELLKATGLPWVIENVPGAPIRKDIVLCGCMFDLPHLQRERWFEVSGWEPPILRLPCAHREPALSVTGHGVGAGRGQRDRFRDFTGHLPTSADAKAAMGIDWMNRDELSQAIPPAYTEWIGAQLIQHLEAAA